MTKRRPRTVARLLEAAYDTFSEVGFTGASIEVICKRAGFTRGAFYSNFASKDELFLALFDEHAQRALERLAQRIQAVTINEPTIERIAQELSKVDPDERKWYLVSTEFTLHAIRNRAAARRLAAHDARLRIELIGLLREMFAHAGRVSTVDLDMFARLLIAIREGSLAQSYVEPRKLPAGTLERTFAATLLTAVSTPGPQGRPAAQPRGDAPR
jgi:AcrR family transcriptional regulator